MASRDGGRMTRRLRATALTLALAAGGMIAAGGGVAAQQTGGAVFCGDYRAEAPRWWKGNTHTHTWWSEGDAPPEVVAAWYVEHGYNFLVLSDHNILQQGPIDYGLTGRQSGDEWYYPWPTFWYPFHTNFSGLEAALASYREHFGDDWVQVRGQGTKKQVRLRTLDEFRHLFEQAGEFMFIQGEEITAPHNVHVNGINLQSVIEPRGGESTLEVLQNNLNAVHDQGVATGRRIIAQINHPNYRFGMTVEDLIAVQYGKGEGFFELYHVDDFFNSHGDDLHVGMEPLWDIVLAKRAAEGRPTLYAVVSDDAHVFSTVKDERGQAQAGLGWIMVRAARLTPDSIVSAMQRGDFYATTGVMLREVARAGSTLQVDIEPQAGGEYTIEFIGTRRGVDLNGTPVTNVPPDTGGRVSHNYSNDIGVTFDRVRGVSGRYKLRGDELYVRARVISSKPHPNGNRPGEREMAWTQPLTAGHRN
ncbi:MAG: hypothetical protein GEV06_24490 [Luteitalea sp.]|nr:hypothetical protein [Luteitalea sp.]